MRLFQRLVFLCFVGLQSLPGADQSTATKLSEISAAADAYKKAYAEIKATRSQRSAKPHKEYVTGLEQLRKEVTATGDLDAVQAVKKEQDRIAKGEDITDAQRAAMTGKLLAMRAAYEREREPFYQAAKMENDRAISKFVSDLQAVELRLTKANRLDRVKLVKDLREKIIQTGEVPDRPDEPNVASAPTGNEKLAAALAGKIKAAIAAKTIKQTAGSRKGTEGWPETPPDGALLVGFELLEMGWEGATAIKTLRPIFMSSEGVFTGKLRGNSGSGKLITVKARPGYAVAGFNTYSNTRLAGIELIFKKYDSVSGKFLAGPQTGYTSKWYGSKLKGPPTVSGGGSNLIIGVWGTTGADVDTIGGIEMP
jgi:hypothetical protein